MQKVCQKLNDLQGQMVVSWDYGPGPWRDRVMGEGLSGVVAGGRRADIARADRRFGSRISPRSF
jgi:hypothetical protein